MHCITKLTNDQPHAIICDIVVNFPVWYHCALKLSGVRDKKNADRIPKIRYQSCCAAIRYNTYTLCAWCTYLVNILIDVFED